MASRRGSWFLAFLTVAVASLILAALAAPPAHAGSSAGTAIAI